MPSAARRIHILGASGSGTSTLGASLAVAMAAPHLDADSYYWYATDPPFTRKRSPTERVAMIERDVRGAQDWVLSGSICRWGDPLRHRFTLAVFLTLDPAVRMERLAARERARYGERILPGGDLHAQYREFMAWARSYDDAEAPTRSLDLHERWLAELACPVIRLDADRSVEALRDEVLRWLAGRQGSGGVT